MSVSTLLGMPRAHGLFTKVIAQSGAARVGADPADAERVAAELGAVLGVDATAATLADVDLDALISAQAAVRDALSAAPDPARWGASIVATSMAFIPVVDGDVVPVHPQAALAVGRGSDITLLAGTNTEEFRLFFVPNGLAAMVTDETLPAFAAALGISPETAAVYTANRPGVSAGDVLCALVTDQFFRNPMLAAAAARQAAAGPAPTYLYEFAWQSPVQGLGAAHAVEIPFVFDNLESPDAALLLGPDAPSDLAMAIHAAWIRFASTGDPGWPAFDPSYPVMIFGGDGGSAVTRDPRGDERASWPT
jgi:para-nitrobenzyl esterase